MRSLLAAVLLAPSLAWAWPVDVALEVPVGSERFERPSSVEWVEVEDLAIAEVERLPGGEVLVTGKKVGRTFALLYSEGKFAVWRVSVLKAAEKARPAPTDAVLALAKKACPQLAIKLAGEDSSVSGELKPEACRKALRPLFESAFLSRQLDVTFDGATLQSQLIELEGALASAVTPRLEARYIGAGLQLRGVVSEAEHRKILWAVFRHSIGRVALDDQLEIQTMDAGPAALEEARP